MRIVPFEPTMTADIARIYNDTMADVPRFHPASVSFFADPAVMLTPHNLLRDERLVVAQVGHEVVGFVHVGVALPPQQHWHPQDEPGVIRYLCYQRGHRPAGQALLEWAEAWVRQHERPSMVAWHNAHRYPFSMSPCVRLPECVTHIWALHTMNGYREEVSDVEFQWCDFVPPPLERPTLGFEMSMQWQEGPAEAPMDIREINVLQADTLLGQCIMLRERANPEWCHCDHLRVEPAYQGQRLGQYLVAVGLREMQQLGCRHALVGTEFDNARAILCYTNLGFRFTHRLATFRKQLA